MVDRDLMTLKFRYIFSSLSYVCFFMYYNAFKIHILILIFLTILYVLPKKYTCQILKIIKIACCYFQYLVCPIEVSVFSTTGQ